MTEKLKGSKKRITAAVIAAVLAVAAVAGIAAAVRATTASTVPVVPVSDLNYGSYLDWQNSVTGMITTEAEQNIYLSDTEKVQEVLVQEGQAVHKGDVLLRYDTKSTMLNLEKEKVNREKIELDIEVAKENIKTLENTSASSEGGDIDFAVDFAEVETTDVLTTATVHEKVLNADAKPVSEGSEYETLGTEYAPYVFLCKGESVVMTKDFIKKWQKKAADQSLKQLYIELAVLDSAQVLQKAWITDIMLLDPNYDIEVDLTSGKTAYAAMNDPEQMAALLRKILVDVPEDERGAWLAAMLDKLMILTEKEEQLEERGALLAAMLNELGREEQADLAEEFAAAASLLDVKALSVMFKSLAENLTPEQVEGIDPEALKEMLTLLLGNLNEEQVKAIDPVVLTSFLEQLSEEQIREIDPAVISAVLSGLSAEQIGELDPEGLAVIFGGLSEEQVKELDPESLRHFFGLLSGEQLKVLLEERGDEVKELLNKMNEENAQDTAQSGSGAGTGESTGTGEGSGGSGASGGSGSSEGAGVSGDTGSGSSDSGEQSSQSEPADVQDEPEEEDAGQSEEPAPAETVQEGAEETDPTPGTASDTSKGDSNLLSSDISYTSDELAKARREAKDKLRDLELNLRESELKIEKAQKALDEGVVTANMNGVIKTAGDPDSPPTDGSAFITVSGSEGLFVKSGIKESRLGTLQEGDHVTVTSWQTGGQYEAEIKNISPYPDSTGMFDGSGTETYYPFTANVLDKSAVLQNGEWVEVSYTTAADSGSSSGAMTVLKAFVREEGSKKYVYVRGEDNRLRKQYIVTGTLSDSGYEVLDGLKESDWIAFPYGNNVKEGAKTREATVSELYN